MNNCNAPLANFVNRALQMLLWWWWWWWWWWWNSFIPNQWYRWKAETLKVFLLLVWRVCDQAFGRYRPLNGAEKWPRDRHENKNFAYRRT